MSNPIYRCPGHTTPVFDVTQMPDIVRWAERIIRSEAADAIVCCGHSGLLVAGALQYLTQVPVFAVRKPGEQGVATGGTQVSGVAPNGAAKRWVWLDDFLSRGGTFRRSRQEVYSAGLISTLDPVAVLSYGRPRDHLVAGVNDQDCYSVQEKPTDRYYDEMGYVWYKQYGYKT